MRFSLYSQDGKYQTKNPQQGKNILTIGQVTKKSWKRSNAEREDSASVRENRTNRAAAEVTIKSEPEEEFDVLVTSSAERATTTNQISKALDYGSEESLGIASEEGQQTYGENEDLQPASSDSISSSSSGSKEIERSEEREGETAGSLDDTTKGKGTTEPKVDFFLEQAPLLPPLPDSDTTTLYTKAPPYFGSHGKDVEWNSFSVRYYESLRALSKLTNYWYELLVFHVSEWSEVLKLHFEECYANDSEDARDDEDQRAHEGGTSSVHKSLPECFRLNPFDLKTGHHFCYACWLKVLTASRYVYGTCLRYFLGASTVENFTKIVAFEGTKDPKEGVYRPAHRTSMQSALCVELNRLRLVSAFPRLYPPNVDAHLYHLKKQQACIACAYVNGYLRSQLDKRGPLIASSVPFSLTKLREKQRQAASQKSPFIDDNNGVGKDSSTTEIKPDSSNSKRSVQNQCDSSKGACSGNLTSSSANIKLGEAEAFKKMNKIEREEEKKQANRILYEAVLEHSKFPITLMEETVSAVIWRATSCWHTRLHHEYLDLLLDKLALYYAGPSSRTIMDDPTFCSKALSSERFLTQLKKNVTSVVSEISSSLSSVTLTDDGGSNDKIDNNLAVKACEISGDVLTRALGRSECFTINPNFVQYSATFLKDAGIRMFHHCKYPKVRWTPAGKDAEEKTFKEAFFFRVRRLLKIWLRHRLVSNTDMLRDTAGVKYPKCCLTKLEWDWYSYYSKHVLRDSNKLTSTSASKVLKILRPYEHEYITETSGEPLAVMFEKHRVDPAHRGFADWLRFLLSGSVFASIPEFTADRSKYVLHEGETLSNGEWFRQPDFPFLWYEGGTYRVYCNQKTWFKNPFPRDLLSYIKKKKHRDIDYMSEDSLTSSDPNDDRIFWKNLESDKRAINRSNDFDDHCYLEPKGEDLKSKLWDELYGNQFDYNVGDEDESENETDLRDSFYLKTCSVALDGLKQVDEIYCPASPPDDGDCLYDALALWVCMVQDGVDRVLAKSVRYGINEACDILLDKARLGSQKDGPLLTVVKELREMKDLVEKYERCYS
jgi:hypothetical protein